MLLSAALVASCATHARVAAAPAIQAALLSAHHVTSYERLA